MLRIAVVGPGALGCLLAGFLSKQAEVWLLDRDPKRTQRIIRNGGIFCEGVSGKWQAKIPITAKTEDIGHADLIILCVKAYDTKVAITRVKSLISERTTILTLQNGLGNVEVISELVDSENILAGSTTHAVTLIDEGRIVHTGKGQTVIGNMEGTIPVAVRQIRETFNKANLETKVSRNIKNVLWSKLIVNVGINALTAVTGLKNGQLLDFESTAEILRLMVTEAVKVAKKRRIKLVYDDALAKVEAVCEATASNRSSMLQDVMNQKRTEIDYINGVIVRQGRSIGIPTPINFTLLNLVKAIESRFGVSLK